jgi:hypothetical protein
MTVISFVLVSIDLPLMLCCTNETRGGRLSPRMVSHYMEEVTDMEEVTYEENSSSIFIL